MTSTTDVPWQAGQRFSSVIDQPAFTALLMAAFGAWSMLRTASSGQSPPDPSQTITVLYAVFTAIVRTFHGVLRGKAETLRLQPDPWRLFWWSRTGGLDRIGNPLAPNAEGDEHHAQTSRRIDTRAQRLDMSNRRSVTCNTRTHPKPAYIWTCLIRVARLETDVLVGEHPGGISTRTCSTRGLSSLP